MTSDAAAAPAPDAAGERRALAQARGRSLRAAFALGMMCAVVGAVISASVVFPLREWLQQLPPVARELAVIGLWRLWVLLLVPLVCYLAARAFSLRPLIAAVAIPLWGELLFVGLDLAATGAEGIYRSGPWFLGRVGTLALGIGGGYWLAQRGHAAALRRQARVEADAEATRARYAAWLDQQAKPPAP